MTEQLVHFFQHTKPLGQGVTQTAYPCENQAWVIKVGLIHDMTKHTHLSKSFGWDGFRDHQTAAHCALLDRAFQQTISPSSYLHVPKTLHITQVALDAFPAELIDSFPYEYLCKQRNDIMLQVVIQERVDGKTLYDALVQDAKEWTPDDWKSVMMQIAISLYQLQSTLGYVMWDTNLNNLMIVQQQEARRLVYQVDDNHLITPVSKLLVKWMDSSSVVCYKMFSPLDAARSSASRLWLNMYVRKQYATYPFCVPVSIVDWLNILIGMEKQVAHMGWKQMLDYVKSMQEWSICAAFAFAYDEAGMTMDRVSTLVDRDQTSHYGWSLPMRFHQVDANILKMIVMQFFASTESIGSTDQFVKAPDVIVPHIKDAFEYHVQRLFWKRSVDAMFVSLPSSWSRAMMERMDQGDLVIPVMSSKFFELGCLPKRCMMPLLKLYPVVVPHTAQALTPSVSALTPSLV